MTAAAAKVTPKPAHPALSSKARELMEAVNAEAMITRPSAIRDATVYSPTATALPNAPRTTMPTRNWPT